MSPELRPKSFGSFEKHAPAQVNLSDPPHVSFHQIMVLYRIAWEGPAVQFII